MADISTNTWPIQHSTNTQPILNWHSTDCRPIYRLCIGRVSTDTRPILDRHIDWVLVDILADSVGQLPRLNMIRMLFHNVPLHNARWKPLVIDLWLFPVYAHSLSEFKLEFSSSRIYDLKSIWRTRFTAIIWIFSKSLRMWRTCPKKDVFWFWLFFFLLTIRKRYTKFSAL